MNFKSTKSLSLGKSLKIIRPVIIEQLRSFKPFHFQCKGWTANKEPFGISTDNITI